MGRAKAHVRVTGVPHAVHHGFRAFNEAIAFVQRKGHTEYDVDVKSEHEKTSPQHDSYAYYAVANGRCPGIYEYY